MQSKAQLKDFVIHLLNEHLLENYYYHNAEHTVYVMNRAIEIGKQEKCSEKEMELLIAAALFHDTGFINIYEGHEEESCLLAKKYLPEFGFTKSEINRVCGMIMATKIPQSPKNKLEEIIADADLAYLGTVHPEAKAENLFRELQSVNPDLSRDAWNKMQISFLEMHRYFTKDFLQKKEPAKLAYLQKLKNAAG